MHLDAYDLDIAHDCHECVACGKTVNVRDLCDRGLSLEEECPDCEQCAECCNPASKVGLLDESGCCATCTQEYAEEWAGNADICAKNAREAEILIERHEWTVRRIVEWVGGGTAA